MGTRHELAAGHAPGRLVAGVAEQVSTTGTITGAACGDGLHEETIAGEWPDEDGVPTVPGGGSSAERTAQRHFLHDATLGVLGHAHLAPQLRITAVVVAHGVER